jgi:hypothetical protein
VLLAAGLGALGLLGIVGGGQGPHTADAAASGTPLTIAVIGDYGGDNGGEYRLADLVARWKPDAVATVGDNLYPTPSTVTGTDKYDLVVGKFFCQFLAGVPAGPYCNGRQSAVNRFFPATGNHDYSDGPIANYLAYFSLPGRGVTSEFPTGSDQYYDVVLGPVHLFFIDSQLTEGAFPAAPTFAEQKAWLQRSMAAATEPWKLVLFHHPAYSSGSTYGSTPEMQWPFGEWGADMVLSGHHHSYERIVRSDTTYFVVGLGGASRFPFDPPIPGSEVRFNDDEGALRLTATDTSLVAEFITTSNVLIDRYTLTKDPAPPPTSTTTSTTTTVPRTTTTVPRTTTTVPRTTTTTSTTTTVPRTTTTTSTTTTVPRTTTTTSTTTTTTSTLPPGPIEPGPRVIAGAASVDAHARRLDLDRWRPDQRVPAIR